MYKCPGAGLHAESAASFPSLQNRVGISTFVALRYIEDASRLPQVHFFAALLKLRFLFPTLSKFFFPFPFFSSFLTGD